MAQQKKKEEGFDGRIWPTLLDFNVNIDAQLTSKANFIFGASTIILLFILNKIVFSEIKYDTITMAILLVMLAGSFVSSLLSLMIVLPKLRIFSKKERIKEDIFYYKNIMTHYSRSQFYEYIKDLPTDGERIGRAYTNQIYSLATNIIPYKFFMLKSAGWTLVMSVFVSILLYVVKISFL